MIDALNGKPQADDKQHRLGIDAGPSGVKQGGFGDCFFESSLASIATTPAGKQQLANMITENPDKSYSVRFPGDPNRPVTVDAKDIQTYGNEHQAPWAKVIETAYLKERFTVDDHHQLKLRNDKPDAYTEPYAALTGTKSAHFQWNPDKPADGVTSGIRTTDGGETRNTEHKMPTDNLANVLQAATEHGGFMRASSKVLAPGVGIKDPATGATSLFYPSRESGYPIVGDHDFSVLGFDAKKQTVTVRNPWGVDSQGTGPLDKPGSTVDGITNKGAGVLEMPLAVFEKHFDNLHVTGWQFKKPEDSHK